ncbi:Uncharacterised protein [Stutzerimonas stutzeri]|nr:Uncharacterised protein [Stutzerimonas stutzeri]CAB5597698.1 Uncharacterised protein [Stutzerimonas stutzeri]CAC9158283.1 Uncharacterised protein [Stutzerimonas stutzeri]CAD0188269.1 Hypothetical_protein [Stutzerimonas stutzeri]
MQVGTTVLHVHALPRKPALKLHDADRELVGVYAVEVDIEDYPLHQATAALNAFRSKVNLTVPGDFALHAYDPNKMVWLKAPQDESEFPSDGEFLGLADVPLIPQGCTLRNLVDVQPEGQSTIVEAGGLWRVEGSDRGTVSVVALDGEATAYVSVCNLGVEFEIHYGYLEDLELNAEQLDDKYNACGNGEHPMFTRSMWREAVSQQDTLSGYWGWVSHKVHSAGWTS